MSMNKEPLSLEEHLKMAEDLEQGMMEGYAFCYTAVAIIAIIILLGYNLCG